MKKVIRLGDPTDHGGSVVSAASSTSMFGKQVACVGDAVSCPRQGHTNCVIVEGDSGWTVGGKAVALEGHKTSCGAALISTLGQVQRDYESSASASSGAPTGAIAAAAALASTAPLFFNDKFQLLDQASQHPLARHAYAIERENGELEHGVTDDEGYTHMLADTVKAENVKIYLE